jgi:hypothetical protein
MARQFHPDFCWDSDAALNRALYVFAFVCFNLQASPGALTTEASIHPYRRTETETHYAPNHEKVKMLRHISIVIVGFLLMPLLFAAAGFGLYHLAEVTNWPESQFGTLARYVSSPAAAVVVGIVVGALAQSRPGVLAGLSVGP